MIRHRARWAVLPLAICLQTASTEAGGLIGDWPYVGQNLHNHGNQRTEHRISTENADDLAEAWHFDAPTGVGGAGISGQPTVRGGVVYFADASGFVRAADADTGELIWETGIPGTQFVTSPTITRRFVYIAESEDLTQLTLTGPAKIFCLDRRDGGLVWEAPLDTSTLPSVVPDIPVNFLAYGGDVAVVGHLAIVGVASIENNLAPGDNAARGSVVAFDRFTGDEVWRVYTTSDQGAPSPEFGGGGGVWSSAAIDRRRKLLFIGTGQAYECPPGVEPCPPAEFEPGSLASPLTDSLLAIDYRTGELVWHRQFTADDVWGANTGLVGRDFDVGAHPNLLSVWIKLPGEPWPRWHDLVGVGDKGGHYYILSRDGHPEFGSDDVPILATLDLDPGGNLGAIHSTAAYDRGVLYIASHAKIVDGQRELINLIDLLSLPVPPADNFSTKIVAIDVRRLLAGQSADRYTLWTVEEEVVEGQQIAGLTTGPLTIANGVLYHASSTGYIRGLDAANGTEIFRRTPLEYVRDDLGQVAVPVLGGVTIVDGRLYVAAGTSLLTFPDGQPSAVVSYALADGP